MAASPTTLLDLATAQTSLGERAFNDITVEGGSLAGIPVLACHGVDDGELHLMAGNLVARAFGALTFRASKSALLEMASDPTGKAQVGQTPVAATKQKVNTFQSAMIALDVWAPFAVDFTADIRSSFINGIDLSADQS
jgi:hypothetical protein